MLQAYCCCGKFQCKFWRTFSTMLRNLKQESCVCMVSGGKETKGRKKRRWLVSDGCYSSLREAPPLPAEEKWRVYLKATEGIEDTTGILRITVLFQKLPFLSLHIQKSHCQGLIIMKWSLKTQRQRFVGYSYTCAAWAPFPYKYFPTRLPVVLPVSD